MLDWHCFSVSLLFATDLHSGQTTARSSTVGIAAFLCITFEQDLTSWEYLTNEDYPEHL